ncbi:MAG: hypothetical protein IPP72_09835 [Chitinophagaceae bacterium]|nr:hypothetical protein [Chitinophagaceae bacterium]
MKSIMLFVMLFAVTSTTNAQLFKKLKEKTQKVLESKSESSNGSSSQNNSPEQTENRSTEKKASLPPDSNCRVVFSLAEDESFLYDESKVLSQNNKLHYSFVVQNKKYEYFLIEDGNRTGPFKEAPLKSMKENEEGSSGPTNDEISVGDDKKDPVALQYSKTINGKLFLVFNGKNYGPYDHVAKMILSPDKKQFFAAVTIGGQNAMTTKMGMGFCFIVNDGTLKQKAGTGGMSIPMKFSVSDGFKHCMITLMDQQSQKIISVTSANKQAEADMAEMYSGNSSSTFVSDNGDIISIPSQSPTQILVNGKEAASFKVPIKSMNRLFLTPDISKSVYYEKGTIYRADGTEESLSGVLFPRVITMNKETAVYYFKIYKNESGSKDVYLCKKVL